MFVGGGGGSVCTVIIICSTRFEVVFVLLCFHRDGYQDWDGDGVR